MYRILITGILACTFSFASFDANAQLPASFQGLLNKLSMSYKATDGLEPVDVVSNSVLSYDYAIKYSSVNFEVRYILRPFDALADEKEKVNDTGDAVADMKRRCVNAMSDIAYTLSDGKAPDIRGFNAQSVKDEFNADWGASTFFEINSNFARGYSYCMLVALHKEHVGDAYVIYLSDNVEEFEKLMERPFHSIKFK